MEHFNAFRDDFERYYQSALKAYFSAAETTDEAVLYSALAPGKRIRPVLTCAAAQIVGAPPEAALVCGTAVEMIHVYSMIHDDLPALDDDDERRGQPSNHVRYGEAIAILAGDALLNDAPEFCLSKLRELGIAPATIVDIVSHLLQCTGSRGLVKGQVDDIQMVGREDLDIDSFRSMCEKKAGRLFEAAMVSGCLLSSPPDKQRDAQIAPFREMGINIGLLAQIADDVADQKQDGNREASGFVALLGLAQTEQLGCDLAIEAENLLAAMSAPKQGKGEAVIRFVISQYLAKITGS